MIYFDNAATSFYKPTAVYDAVVRTMLYNSANAGRGGYKEAVRANEILYQARKTLADFFCVQNPERIVFTQNTTHALNMAIKGVLSYGDHVIVSSMEHNSVIRPVVALSKQKRITYSVLGADRNGKVDVNRLEQLIRPNTRLICMTHASNVCGTVVDVGKAAEIAKKHGILFLADCAQTAGVLPLDFSTFDLAAFPGHKGLMGPMGTGGLYAREEITLSTIFEGGTGSLSESLLQPEMMPDRLESGTQNIPAIAGMAAAATFLKEMGMETIRQHETNLCRYFEEQVREIEGVTIYGAEEKTAVCALNIAGVDCVTAAQILDETYNIAVRAGLHCAYLAHKTLGTEKTGCVRFSFGLFNTKDEVDAAVEAIQKIAKR